jgi:aspartyl-tRNA(Asn)/glutamyl-tRNA(Gln) amidotransferase subunit A
MTEWHEHTALELGRQIEAGTIDPRDLTRYFLSRAEADPQGDQIYMRLTRERAEQEAAAAYERAKSGTRRSPLDGVPLSWKDLFDTADSATEGGSRLLKGRVPAKDAACLIRATKAGTICLGKTSMTEFAYSGLGYNPTCGSPTNPFDEITPRVPGGSSGGAGVSVAKGLAAAAIGTDTGGSVRIPAAWNGLVGLKTTFGAIPLDGVLPLSPTLDTVGPLTKDVADAAALFAILSEQPAADIEGGNIADLNLGILKNDAVWSQVDEASWPLFDHVLEELEKKAPNVKPHPNEQVDALIALIGEMGSFVPFEAYQAWGKAIENDPNKVFPWIASRILPGEMVLPDHVAVLRSRLQEIRQQYWAATQDLDAVILPTVGFVPPKIEEILQNSNAYERINLGSLFNTSIGNQLGLCALSLPLGLTARTGRHPPLPVGLMLMSAPGKEATLLRTARTLERHLQ